MQKAEAATENTDREMARKDKDDGTRAVTRSPILAWRKQKATALLQET